MTSHKKRTISFRKVQKRARRLFITVGVISSISLIIWGVLTLQHVLEPITLNASDYSSSVNLNPLDNDVYTFTTIYTDSQEVTETIVTSIDKRERTVKELRIPKDILVTMPLGLEEYPIRSLQKVADLTHSDHHLIFRESIHQLIGTLTDELIITQNHNSQWITSATTIPQIIANPSWVKDNFDTELTKLELIRLINDYRYNKNYHYSNVNLSVENLGTKVEMKDGSRAIRISNNDIDPISKRIFEDIQIKEEGATLSIINTTQVEGLARYLSRVLQNTGLRITEITSAKEAIPRTYVEVHNGFELNSHTLKKIATGLQGAEIKSTNEPNQADITIFIGKDYAYLVKGAEE